MGKACKERERLAKSGNANVPTLPVGAIRGYLCFRCFEPSEKLNTCAGCQRTRYCSKECQRLDWAAVHKKRCKVLRKVNDLQVQQYQDAFSWDEYSRNLMANVRFAKSESDTDAYWIVQAQPYCAECRRTVVQLSARNINLKACAQCRIISTCNACSTTHTQALCTAYQDFANIEKFRISFFEDMGRASVVECTRSPRRTYKPLNEAANWYDYYVNISDKSQIRNKIKNDFSAIEESSNPLPAEAIESEEQRRLFLTLATDNLTMPLTVLSALEDLSLAQKPTISIHLLGATDREFTSMAIFEEIMHLVPTLKTLHITAVGPSSLVDATGPYMDDVSLPCCPACQASRRQRIIRSYQGLYHDFVSSAFYKKPDLIVAFNSGHVDEDGAAENWTPTIQMIVDSDIPALFTTYNADEAWREEARLRSLGARIVVQPDENRWRGLVPMPEFLESEGTMWFQNWYRYVIQGRLA